MLPHEVEVERTPLNKTPNESRCVRESGGSPPLATIGHREPRNIVLGPARSGGSEAYHESQGLLDRETTCISPAVYETSSTSSLTVHAVTSRRVRYAGYIPS